MKKTIISISIALLVLTFFSGKALGIGMMTEPIVIKDILRGQETIVNLTLLNSESREVVYGLKAEGQISKWVSFYNIEDKNFKSPIQEIKMPSEKFVDVRVKFSVPKDMPNGKYTGSVLAFLASSGEVKNEETSVDVSQQVGRNVTITVTDKEIINLESAIIPLQYGVRSNDNLKIKIEYYNKGNVALKPSVQLKISRDGNNVFGAIFLYPESEEAIKPEERKTISAIDWPTTGQANGKYIAEVKILNGTNVLSEKSFEFEIGNFDNSVLLSSVSSFLKGNGIVVLWFLVGVLFIVVAVLLNNFKKRGINLKKGQEIINNSFKKLF
jgi:hypothetical protein